MLDAPFNTDYAENAIEFLTQNDMMEDDGVIVFEKDYNKVYTKKFDGYKRTDKKYGTVGVVYFRKIG